MNVVNIMNILTFLIFLIFFIFRNSFTLLKGKRDRKQVTSFVYVVRKLIEVSIYFLVPILLLLGIIRQEVYTPLYYAGLLVSIIGLVLMMWTRFNRNKDWGFMGDGSGVILFTDGPYKFTRHPYYIGAIFVGVGIYLQLNYPLALLMVPVVFFVIHVIKKEDDFLQKEFSSKFIEYKNKVGIFPWFY